jgi:predicted secreted protein
MNAEQAKKLRAEFPDAQIGILPKPTKKENPKGKCDVCGGWHGLPAVHLDYVGHAATCDRLLQVDPDWTWRPFTVEERQQVCATPAELWIWLTVCGVTRPGVGDGQTAKERIGDAIRNAAMRFGVALDLWAKEDLHSDDEPNVSRARPAPVERPPAGEAKAPAKSAVTGDASPAPSSDPAGEKEAELFALVDQLGALAATKESCEKHRAQWSDDRSKYLDWLDRCIKAAERNLREKPDEDSQFAAKAAEAQAKRAAA